MQRCNNEGVAARSADMAQAEEQTLLEGKVSAPAHGKLGKVTSKLIMSFSPIVLSTYMSDVVLICKMYSCGGSMRIRG